jgi:hypothetical protein
VHKEVYEDQGKAPEAAFPKDGVVAGATTLEKSAGIAVLRED